MADYAKAEAAVLARVFENMLGRPPDGHPAKHERPSAVGFLSFSIPAPVVGLSDGVLLVNP
jgi:hypothetical protein